MSNASPTQASRYAANVQAEIDGAALYRALAQAEFEPATLGDLRAVG